MNIQTLIRHGTHFVADLKYLSAQERGPVSAKAQVAAWIDLLAREDEQAWQLEVLKSLCDALSVLAFSNAAFCKVPSALRHAGEIHYEIEDRGGYLVALKSMGRVIKIAPLCDECLSTLRVHARNALAGHLDQILCRLQRR